MPDRIFDGLDREKDSFVPRYDLSESETSLIVAGFIDRNPARRQDRFGYYKVSESSDMGNVARSLERTIFEKYFGNDADEMSTEYGPYEEQSDFYIAIDRKLKQPAGVIRIIRNGPKGLKTLNDIEDRIEPAELRTSAEDIMKSHNMTSLENCWDLGTAAVPDRYRKSTNEVSTMLYRTVYKSARSHGTEHFISAVDARPLKKITDFTGIPFVPLAGMKPFSYLGSESTQPIYGYVPEFFPRMFGRLFTKNGALATIAGISFPLVFGTKDRTIHL